MRYDESWTLDPVKHEALIAWLEGEGLEPSSISVYRFSVHKGVVSGRKYVRDANGKLIARGNKIVTAHFRQRQINPLPEVLQ